MESCGNSNYTKLLRLSLLPIRMKKIHPKTKTLEWSQHFSHYKSMGIVPGTQGQLTLQSLVVLIKNKEEPIKSEGARVIKRFSPL